MLDLLPSWLLPPLADVYYTDLYRIILIYRITLL